MKEYLYLYSDYNIFVNYMLGIDSEFKVKDKVN